jgi:formylglycine-generating enzyme required for sulfatase activity
MTANESQVNLEQLLSLLRAQGLAVGAGEYQRLARIFKTQPELSNSAFRELLCTVLAKDNAQRQQVIDVFNRFVREDNATTSRVSSKRAEKKDKFKVYERTTSTEAKKKTNHTRALFIGLPTLALLVLLWFFLQVPPPVEPENIPSANKTELAERNTDSVDLGKPSQKNKTLIPDLPIWSLESVAVNPRPVIKEFLPPLALFLGAGLGFLFLLAKTLKQLRQRDPKPIKYKHTRGYHTPPVKQAFYQLFTPRDRQVLAWGVGNYLAENQARRIDVDKSVESSASQGLPVITYEQQVHEREVWLWQDRQNNNPLQIRILRELKQALKQSNITVKHGFFNGLPYRVMDETGELQYQLLGALPEVTPLVLVCMSANNVNRYFNRAPTETELTFQHLKQWPALAVVDCDPRVGSLKKTLSDYQLTYLAASQVSDWLASQGQGSLVRPQCHLGDVYRWAGACALAQRHISEGEAYAVHHALGLSCTWQYSSLRELSLATEEGLNFSDQQAVLINGLNDNDRKAACRFWQQRLTQIDQLHTKDPQYPDWEKSSRRYEMIEIRRALLDLWDKTDQGIDRLSDLYEEKGLRRAIMQHLAQYACVGSVVTVSDNEKPYIELPFQWQSISAQHQQELLKMGFSGEVKTLRLAPDKVSSAALGALAGLVCVGFYFAIHALMDTQPRVITDIDSAIPDGYVEVVHNQQLLVGTAKNQLDRAKVQAVSSLDAYTLQENTEVALTWSRKIVPAQEILSDEQGEEAQLWRFGTTRNPLSRDTRIIASLATIQAKPSDLAAQTLAIKLLDSGSADQVLITKQWRKYQTAFKAWSHYPDSENSDKQVQSLFIGKAYQPLIYLKSDTYRDWNVPNHLVFNGSASEMLSTMKTAQSGKQGLEQLSGLGFNIEGEPYLFWPDEITLQPIVLEQGIKLVPIPAGQFEMGSNNGDDDEKPVHTVTISKPFWISETEVTHNQYQGFTEGFRKLIEREGLSSRANLQMDEFWNKTTVPVTNVDWQDASDYADWLTENNTKGVKCRLPSEAEWEYAARAGSKTKYYWGDEPSRDHANYSGVKGSDIWDRVTAPVKSFKPNGWGLYDMSGNVYEWTQDRYHGNYQGAPDDGSAWESGGRFRVLRGGSWYVASNDVRSAGRDFSDFGNFNVGFRVVCSPIDH